MPNPLIGDFRMLRWTGRVSRCVVAEEKEGVTL